jgi:hypothetical protein
MNLNVAFDMSQVGAGAAIDGAADGRVIRHRRSSIIRGLYAISWSGGICVSGRTRNNGTLLRHSTGLGHFMYSELLTL